MKYMGIDLTKKDLDGGNHKTSLREMNENLKS